MTDKIDNIGQFIHYSDLPVVMAICKKLNVIMFTHLENKKDMPKTFQGVYMFIDKRIIQYIGESKNIKRRIGEHVKYAGCPFIYFIEDDPGTRKRLETALIAAINPPGNSVKSLFGRKHGR
jgi:septin family protein